jgi:cytoskeletal protein CcmA (bactofilin family)
MFGKTKDNATDKSQTPAAAPVHQLQRSTVTPAAAPESADKTSIISSDMTVVGKITGEGLVKIFGRVEGELRASTILISDGAHVEGEVAAEDVTIGGSVKGTIHANRVKLNSTAVVEGDIFHRSLAIEENARFEGSSRREDNTVATPRLPLSRPAAQAAAVGSAGKPNGAPGGQGHTTPATE